MPYANLNASLSDADRALILQKTVEIKALMPFLVNLTVQERKKGIKMGAKAEGFIVDILYTLENNVQYVPPFVNPTDITTDIGAYINLLTIELRLKSLSEALADTRLALLQELMPSALAVYANVKQAAKANVPGSDTALNRLKPYFKKEKKKK